MSTVRRDVEAGGRRRKSRDALTSRPEVERLLIAASAPASPRELAGEHAAVELFHRAHRETTPSPRSDRVSPAPSARTGLKAALASAGAVALLSSGVAMAASGHAPWSPGTAAHAGAARSSHAADPSHPADPTHPAHPSGRPSNGVSAENGPNVHAFGGLCRAYTSGNKSEHGKALESRAFRALITAAGGTDNVPAFCGTLTTGPSGSHSSHPTQPSHPSQPASPTHPVHPTHPSHPSHPTQGASPAHPTHPSHPSHPTQGSSPTHPTHPSHPTNTHTRQG
jgi:hypothetical protein